MAEKEIVFEIKEHLGVLAKYPTGWSKELNLISWNGQTPKFDIRDWDNDHVRMSRGVTLHSREIAKVVDLYLNNKNRNIIEEAKAAEEKRWEKIAAEKNTKGSSEKEDSSSERDEAGKVTDGEDFDGGDVTPLAEEFAAINDGTPF